VDPTYPDYRAVTDDMARLARRMERLASRLEAARNKHVSTTAGPGPQMLADLNYWSVTLRRGAMDLRSY
jgi:hypothetical protein